MKKRIYRFVIVFGTIYFCSCGDNGTPEDNPFSPTLSSSTEEVSYSEMEYSSSSDQTSFISSSSIEVSSSSEIALSSSEVFSSSSKIESSSSMEVSSSSEIALSSSEVFSSSSKIESSSSMEVSSSSEIALSSSEVFSSSSKIESSSSEVPTSSSIEVSSSSEIALSSSEVFSSSSKIESSSSEKIPSKIYDCNVYDCVTTEYLNPDIEYGEFLDVRDSQVYRTVQIGEQTWMAQNLNFASYESRCFIDSLDRCAIVGRLYHWEDALIVCPEGWHLPDTTEYNTLVDYVTKEKPDYSVMNSLSSKSTKNSDFEGYDFFGFSIIHGSGYYWYSQGIYDTGALFRAYSYFWTASESNRIDLPAENYARIRSTQTAAFAKPSKLKANAYSVRCIKD